MDIFSRSSKLSLARASIFQNTPIYVQFYITARCNLTCKQCNIRYANADMRECTLDEIKRIADNFAAMGVAMVLLTGGEPFVRADLPEIIREFESRGIHVRMQTNGLASKEAIHKVTEYGGNDISISLDSLSQKKQDLINGGFNRSWNRALESMSYFTQYLPTDNSFASLGCVIQRDNLHDVEDVIKFGTKINWHTSLVPIHVSDTFHPLGFRTYNKSLRFKESEFAEVHLLIERVRQMRNEGYLLYDSDQYLDDIKQFIQGKPTHWRDKNKGVCDSPNLYFAVLPNGDFAPCCDWRMPSSISTYSKNFPSIYKDRMFRRDVFAITSACSGCMYGSYPEMTISMRFMKAKLQRIKTFITNPPKKDWPVSYDTMVRYASDIIKNKKNVKKK